MEALLLCPQYSKTFVTGPVKRALQIQQLLEYCGYKVTIACKNPQSEENICQHGTEFKELLKRCSLVYSDAYHMASFRIGKRTKAFKLVDLYIPFFIEHRHSLPSRCDPENLLPRFQLDQAYISESLYHGDAFLAAGDRQIDLYSGMLYLFDRKYGADLPLLNLPFLINPTKPNRRNNKRIHMAWLGGAWHWFDLSSVIQLLQTWLPDNPTLQFSFVGIEHPTDSRLHNIEQVYQAKDLANQFKNQVQILPWMNYAKYCSWLENLDLAIVIGKTGHESRYSIRTRFCELLEKQIPIICNEGDYFSNWIDKFKLGEVVSNETLVNSLNYWKENLIVKTEKYQELYSTHAFEVLAPKFKEFLDVYRKLDPGKNNPYLRQKPKSLYYRQHQLRHLSNKLITKVRPGKK